MTICRKQLFALPEGVIYLDGNSLGPLPRAVGPRLMQAIEQEWGGQLIGGWNDAGWMAQPSRVGNLIAPLIGAPAGSVMMGDTLSIKLFQALSAALSLRDDRKVVLTDSGNFPTDLYMAQSLIDALGKGHELRVVAPEEVRDAIDEQTAVVMLTQVDYRTGRMHDLQAITRATHDAGAISLWDLAHSAGALPVDLATSGCEFAVGCTYKYLNGGPGAPAFIYVRPDLIESVEPALAGWMGHADPFAFDLAYHPAPSIERFRVGTPPVLQMTALEEALEVWADVDLNEVRAASIALSELFIVEIEARCPDLTLVSPRAAEQRGSQVSFAHPNGYAIVRALIEQGVIGDFRAPNILRFGFTPLYLNETDVHDAASILGDVIEQGLWDQPGFHVRQQVT